MQYSINEFKSLIVKNIKQKTERALINELPNSFIVNIVNIRGRKL